MPDIPIPFFGVPLKVMYNYCMPSTLKHFRFFKAKLKNKYVIAAIGIFLFIVIISIGLVVGSGNNDSIEQPISTEINPQEEQQVPQSLEKIQPTESEDTPDEEDESNELYNPAQTTNSSEEKPAENPTAEQYVPDPCLELERRVYEREATYLDTRGGYLKVLMKEIQDRYSGSTDSYIDITTVQQAIDVANERLASIYDQVETNFKIQKDEGCTYSATISEGPFPDIGADPGDWATEALQYIY